MSIKDLFSKQKQSKVSKDETKAKTKSLITKAESVKEEVKTADINTESVFSHRVLLRPLVTEKGARQTEQNKYFFMVSASANKIIIKQAIFETYGIRPVNVNIVSLKGKNVNFGRRQGKRKDWKKAIITLPAGKTIDVYKGV